MIDTLFEQHVVQNTGLAAETLWHAVQEAYEAKGRTEGVPLPLIFVVLPLTFHRQSALALASKTQPGAIYKALAEDREITVGLQERMEFLAERTFQGLSIAFATRLLLVDSDAQRQLVPARRTLPISHVTEDVRTIFAAAKRVGHGFAEMNAVQMAVHLNIRF